jgi:hypothetical protein
MGQLHSTELVQPHLASHSGYTHAETVRPSFGVMELDSDATEA